LLIDEIGDLDINLQPKLLRVIQRMEVQRVGSSRPIRVDVRVIAATRRDLDREVQAGRFRDDLFYRLAVARIELPPLRRRTGDIDLLTRHFWTTGGGAHVPIDQTLLYKFADYAWPGNVRELRNAVMRRLALGDLADLDPRAHGTDFDGDLARESAAGGSEFIDAVVTRLLPLSEARQEVVQEFERRYVDHVVAVHGGNVTRAATTAGVARRYFHLLRAKYSNKEE
jgi:transcriptional regulator with GAF, ATPase, and Fis domain